jgi:hypothetical protein
MPYSTSPPSTSTVTVPDAASEYPAPLVTLAGPRSITVAPFLTVSVTPAEETLLSAVAVVPTLTR